MGPYDLEYFSAAVLVSLIFKTPLVKKHEMILRLQNYDDVIRNENSCIKFINNKINNFKTCDIAQNYRSQQRVVQLLSQHNLKISNHRHIQKLRQRK
jgi:hypothetical protein